ncbi:TIGR03759 family integrating conjugative element protein [Lentisalinibacter orientalis]|uniref:TIGR03759 family integrating conjugative element protein n=1 Tax=Lentisalinibacter orientalis TaxID=2992241 RepID=UPI00386B361C
MSPARAAESDVGATSEAASSVTWSDLTATERARAETWDLTPTEWKRYRALMAGIRGSVSPDNLSPIEVLGIHARDEAERKRYAERWAILMREDAERILAFQRAYDAAYERLFPEESLIERAWLPARVTKTPMLEPTDRILLFLRPDCAACEAVLKRVLAKRGEVAGIDLYLSEFGPGEEGAIRNWAARQGIDPAWVRTREVTLNFEAGALERLSGDQPELPYLMRRRGESVTPLPGSAL